MYQQNYTKVQSYEKRCSHDQAIRWCWLSATFRPLRQETRTRTAITLGAKREAVRCSLKTQRHLVVLYECTSKQHVVNCEDNRCQTIRCLKNTVNDGPHVLLLVCKPLARWKYVRIKTICFLSSVFNAVLNVKRVVVGRSCGKVAPTMLIDFPQEAMQPDE